MSDEQSNSSSSTPPESSQEEEEERAPKRVRRTPSSAHLISEYQKLLRDNNNNSAIDNALERLNQADQLLRNVQTTQEASLDSKVMVLTGRDTAKYATGLKMNDELEIDIDEVITGLRGLLYGQGGEEEDEDEEDEDATAAWEKLGNLSLVISRRAPWSQFILGPVSFERSQRVINRNGAAAAAAQVEGGQGTGVGSRLKVAGEGDDDGNQRVTDNTTLAITNVYNALKENNEKLPLNLFKVIINPKSFSQSVENMFYLSFLVHEGKIKIYEEEREKLYPLVDIVPELANPNLYPIEYEEEFDKRSQMISNQSIFNLDMFTFNQSIKAWNITESCIIPNRQSIIDEDVPE